MINTGQAINLLVVRPMARGLVVPSLLLIEDGERARDAYDEHRT